MNATQSSFADPEISREVWAWVRELIRDVEQDAEREAFLKKLFQWDLAVRQFRKLETARLLLQPPSPVDLENHAICLHALLAVGGMLRQEARKFKPEELERFQVREEDIEAYIEDLKQSLAEWHHRFSNAELQAAQARIFGGAT